MLSKEDKIVYLNTFIDILSDKEILNNFNSDVVQKYKHHYLLAPKLLYKYVKLNNYTYDSINKNYVYLTPIKYLDDDFEGFVANDKIAMNNALELLNTDKYYSYFIETTLKKRNMYDIYSNLIFNRKKVKDYYNLYFKAKYIVEEHSGNIDDITVFSSMFDAYTETNEIRTVIKEYAKNCIKNPENSGMCCFTENNKSQVMWNMYADNCRGCMIEYDLPILDICNIVDLTPVIYDSKREIDPFKIAIDIYLDCLEDGSNVDKALNKKMYYQLLTKDEEWSFQNEWRIIGNSKKKNISPVIRAIYLGKNVSKKDEKKLIKIAKKKRFVLYKQEFGITNKEIIYKPIFSTFMMFNERNEIQSRIKDDKDKMYIFKFNDYENYLYSRKYSSFIKSKENIVDIYVKDKKNNVTYSILEKINNQIIGYYDVKYYNYLPRKQELMLIENDFKNKIDLLKKCRKCNLEKNEIIIFASDYILNEIVKYDCSDLDSMMLLIEKDTFDVRYETLNSNNN